jgi:tetratricopeptide (TPR) repeat protein/DNA-binding winged helix-turn-helix (wHTH) protein
MAVAVFRIRDANIEVRPDLGCLRRADGEEVYLRPKTFQTLQLLLVHRARVVGKDEIARTIWPETAVTDDAVVQCIVEIRKVLGDDARTGRYIRTFSKSGYRFVGEVDEVSEVASSFSRTISEEFRFKADATYEESTAPEREALAARASAGPPRRGLVAVMVAGLIVLATAGLAVLGQQRSDRTAQVLDLLPAASDHRQTIAVMFLENQSQTPELDWLREGLADMLVTGLSRSKTLSVVGRQQVALLLDRAGVDRAKPIELSQAVELARRAHLDHFVLGTFAKLGGTIRIDLRLHDSGGRLVTGEALTIDKPDDLLRQVDVLGWRLAQHFGALESTTPSNTALTTNLDAYRYYSLGVTKANSFHSLEAIDLFTRATELDPQFAMAFARIGYVYGVTGEHVDRARPYLAKAYSMSNRLSEKDRLQVEAWNALVQFDYPSAINSFAQLIRAYPTEVEAYSRLGLLLAGERRYDESLSVFNRGLAVDPEAGDVWNRLGGLYDTLGRSADAIAARQKYVALQPSEANAHDSLGFSYQAGGRYDEAIASYKHALELAPGFAIARVHLGHAYVQTGRYDAAAAEYRRFIDSVSSEVEQARGYESLALLARREGRSQEAAEILRTRVKVRRIFGAIIRLDAGEPIERLAEEFRAAPTLPNRGSRNSNRLWLTLQARLALKRGAETKAVELLQAALAEPAPAADADTLEDCLANAYLELQRYDEAIAEYGRVLRINPNYPLAHYRLGLAYEGKRRSDFARKSFEEFLQVWAGADRDVPEIVSAQAYLASLH